MGCCSDTDTQKCFESKNFAYKQNVLYSTINAFVILNVDTVEVLFEVKRFIP